MTIVITNHDSIIMTTPNVKSAHISQDPLGDYVAGAHALPAKLVRIANNQHHVAQSLGRAVIALRSMAALNQRPTHLESKKSTLNTGNNLASR